MPGRASGAGPVVGLVVPAVRAVLDDITDTSPQLRNPDYSGPEAPSLVGIYFIVLMPDNQVRPNLMYINCYSRYL